LFASLDNLTEDKLHLLQIAASFHDSGFLEGRIGHEERGALRAVSAMEEAGCYSHEQMETVHTMIRDTKLTYTDGLLAQRPTIELSKYLLDADLGNLGRADFFKKVELEKKEVEFVSEADFLKKLLLLISSKEWYSPAGKSVREKGWLSNLKQVKELYSRVTNCEIK
jgi:hypothetical protein